MTTPIHLTVVGLGPGDPDLITIKGLRALEAADLIFAPRSRDDEASRALRIAEPWIDPQRQQIVPVTIPMQRDTSQASAVYWDVATRLGAQLHAQAARHPQGHARAAYLLLGDPLLYGTFTMIGNALQRQHPTIAVTIIPGITSFAATAARLGLPLSSGDERVAILPAPADPAVLRELCAQFATVVLLKVGRTLPQLLAVLTELALLDTAVYAEHLGMPEERIVRDLGRLRGYKAPYLSLVIVRQGGC
ncbi:MAG: precorrin-2 C(20)-methyltransferase [Oscillochloridaceae bacterium umkhey_bin13]